MKASRVPVRATSFLPHIANRPKLVTSSARNRDESLANEVTNRGQSSANDVINRGQSSVNRSLTSPLERLSKDKERAALPASSETSVSHNTHLSHARNSHLSQLQRDLQEARFQSDMLRYELRGREVEFGEEVEALRHQLVESRDECMKLRDKMAASDKVKVAREGELEMAIQQVREVEQQLAVSTTEVNNLHTQLDVANSQINALQEELLATKDKVDDSLRELAAVKHQTDALKEELNAAKSLVNTLRGQFENAAEQSDKEHAELVKSQQEKQLLAEQLNISTVENQRLTSSEQTTVGRIQELESELAQCKTLLASKDTIICNFEAEYCSEIRRLKATIGTYEEQKEQLVQHAASADTRRETAAKEQSKTTNSNNNLKRRCSKLEEEISKCQSENEALKKRINQHEKKASEKDKQIKVLTSNKDKIVLEASRIKQATEELGNVLTEKQAMIEKLQRDVINMHSSIIPLTSPRLGPGLALALSMQNDVIDTSSSDGSGQHTARKIQPVLVLTEPVADSVTRAENRVSTQRQAPHAPESSGDGATLKNRVKRETDSRQKNAASLQQRLAEANSRVLQLETYLDQIYSNASFRKLNLK